MAISYIYLKILRDKKHQRIYTYLKNSNHMIHIPGLTFIQEIKSPPLEGCPKGGVANNQPFTKINNIPIFKNSVEKLPYNHALTRFVKDKRKAGILSEVLFWQQVHKGHFHNIDFDRQRIIGNYIVDFYVKKLGLVVEIDGSSHDEKQEYDAKRQKYLEELGLRVYRISDYDVKNNLDIVISELENYIVKEYGEKPPWLSATPPEDGNLST